MTMNQGLIPAKWAALTPNRMALYDVPNDRRITFADLDERVRRLANGLRGLGLEKGDRVAVLTKNSIEFQELFFAVGRAGLILQPLNWRLATPSLLGLVADATPKVLITASEFRSVAEELSRSTTVDHWLEFGPGGSGTYEELLASSSPAEPIWTPSVGGDDPFFILYTGGTTGESKGALHSHTSAAAGMLNQTVAERVVPPVSYSRPP